MVVGFRWWDGLWGMQWCKATGQGKTLHSPRPLIWDDVTQKHS